MDYVSKKNYNNNYRTLKYRPRKYYQGHILLYTLDSTLMLNIYRASAGSGKTYQLTKDYIQLLFKAQRAGAHRRILAVTFTNKATDEMKSRILKELHALSKGEKSDYRADLMAEFKLDEEAVNRKSKSILTNILHDYSSFSISTIDRFFQQVIRAFARDIGVHGGYNLELDTDSMREQSVDNLFLDLGKSENKQLLTWLTAYAEERIEQSEHWNVRNDINDLGKEIFKESYQHKAEETNTKLHDREFLTAYKKSLSSIKTDFETQLKSTAEEALTLIGQQGLNTEDFKGGSRSAMKRLENFATGETKVTDTFFSIAEDVANAYTKTTPKDKIAKIEKLYAEGLQKQLSLLVELLKVDIILYNTASMVLKHINTLGIMSDLAIQIKKLSEEQNAMLISDTNLWLNKIIDNSDAPFVYEKAGIHIDNFMIDEFQDTSVLQWKNFHPLMANSLSAGNFNLVVGDVKQSIYRWRNSDWKLLDEKILTEFRGDEIYEVPLETNWRSDANIIDFNNAFFFHAAEILQSKLNESLNPALPLYPHLQSFTQKITHAYQNIHQQKSPKAGIGRVQLNFIDTDESEDKWKTQSLNKLPSVLENLQHQGYRPNDIAILVRTNGEEQDVIRKLLNFKTTPEAKPDICYDIMGNEGLLVGGAASIRFILGVLKLFVNSNDMIQRTIVNYEYAKGKSGKSESDALNAAFVNVPEAFEGISPLFTEEENTSLLQLKHSSIFDMVEHIVTLFNIGNWHSEAVFIQAFQDLVFKFTTSKTADLNSFLKWWEKSGVKQCISTPDNQSAIRIMTVHKSKGLDFKVVIMPFCDWELDKRKGNSKDILWCQPSTVPFNALPLLPIEYNNTLKDTIFSEYYLDEQMHRYIDNLNVAYVAFTRAKHELICFAPAPKKEIESLDKVNSLSALLLCCMEQQVPVEKDIISLKSSFNKANMTFTLGSSAKPFYSDEIRKTEQNTITTYPSVSSNSRLHLHHQSLDYWLENQNLKDSQLNYGLIMHDVLRNITLKTDQAKAINELILSGRISEDEGTTVAKELENFWALPGVNEWFESDAKVMNEATILMPSGNQYRPDRVVIKGEEAVIVDYKFGETENPKYKSQVRNYMNLVAEMGYQVTGYVCYISLKKVEKVGNEDFIAL